MNKNITFFWLTFTPKKNRFKNDQSFKKKKGKYNMKVFMEKLSQIQSKSSFIMLILTLILIQTLTLTQKKSQDWTLLQLKTF